ncbi:MAG: HU family DNA-binding protein [bacterium]
MGLNKAQLIAEVAKETGLTKVDADKAVRSTFDAISKSLKKGTNVTLIGFGTFSVYNRKARKGKNPRTGETLKIAAKKVPKFKAGKALTDAVGKKAAKK